MANTDFGQDVLSGSTDGRGILIAASSSPGTTIHTAQASASLVDQVWLYAANNSTASQTVRVQFGSTATADLIRSDIPYQAGLHLIVAGLALRNSLPVRAWATEADKVSMFGYIIRASA